MKKLIRTLILISIVALGSDAVCAQQWYEVKSGTYAHLNSISFGSELVGYIAANDSVLLKTTDGGSSWFEQETSGFNFSKNNAAVDQIDFVNDSVGYAIVSTSAANGQVYSTLDGGKNWGPEGVSMCFGIRVFGFDQENAVAVGTDCFIGQSVDFKKDGVWKRSASFTWANSKLQAVDFRNKDYGFVAGDGGLAYRTTNGGESWDTIQTSTTHDIFDIRFADDSTLFAVVDSQQNTLIYSLDSGSTWQEHQNSLTFFYPRLKALSVSNQRQVMAVGRIQSFAGRGFILSGPSNSDLWGPNPVSQPLNGVTFANDTLAYAVGDSGLIVRNYDLTLRVEQVPDDGIFSIHPNPVRERLFLKSGLHEEVTIRLYDVCGKEVLNEGYDNEGVDVSTLAPGLYNAVVEENDKYFTYKVLKE